MSGQPAMLLMFFGLFRIRYRCIARIGLTGLVQRSFFTVFRRVLRLVDTTPFLDRPLLMVRETGLGWFTAPVLCSIHAGRPFAARPVIADARLCR